MSGEELSPEAQAYALLAPTLRKAEPVAACRARIAEVLRTLAEDKARLALEAIGHLEDGIVRARRWKECARKMRRIARMLGRRCDVVDAQRKAAERKLELVRRWARVWTMHPEQRAALKRALDGYDHEERAR